MVLAFITLIAFAARFISLSTLPASLSMDEVTFGYSAYSIYHTGRDEYGKLLPLAFQGIGDYKPPVDVYLKVPFIAVFGLNEFSVRAPGATVGALTVFAIYHLLAELSFTKKARLFASLMLAALPWHIVYSRSGYEAITGLFFVCLGIYFFLHWKRRGKERFLYASITSFSLSVWSYHAERVYTPLLFTGLLLLHRKKLWEVLFQGGRVIRVGSVLLFFSLPFFYTLVTTNGVKARAVELWVAKDPWIDAQLHHEGYESLSQMVFENNSIVIGRALVRQYLNYFDPRFVFWKGLGLTPKGFPDMGLVPWVLLPITVIGFYQLMVFAKKDTQWIAALLLFLGPLPGAFARGDPSPIRILLWVPLFCFLLASGYEYVSKQNWRYPFWLLLAGLWVFNFLNFVNLYRSQFPKYYAGLWHWGYKEVSLEICDSYSDYSKVIVTDKYGIEVNDIRTIPNYYFLFHCKFDPLLYQKESISKIIEFRQPQWRIDSLVPNSLIIGSPWDFPEGFPEEMVDKKILFPNGKPAFYFVKT